MTPPAQLSNRLRALLMRIYPDRDTDDLTTQVIEAFWPESATAPPPKDIILHLQTLYRNGLLEMV